MAHPRPNTMATAVPNMPVAASSQSSRKMISPAYMLPNSRSACDSGLETDSIAFSSRVAGHSSGLAPDGAQNSSGVQRPDNYVYRQEVHGVHHQHPHEHRKRRRSHEAVAVAVVENALYLLVDEL